MGVCAGQHIFDDRTVHCSLGRHPAIIAATMLTGAVFPPAAESPDCR
jgi:hypothetical protein